MGTNDSWGSESYYRRTYSWRNDTHSWGNESYPWGNESYPWRNESFPWGNESFPWGNYSDNWFAGYSLFPNFSFNVRLTLSILFGLAQLVGILGNILVITATMRERRLQNNYYLLLMNLATSDLVLLLFNAFDTAIFLWFPDVKLFSSTLVCKMWYPLQECIFILEGQILILLASLRLRAVQPFKKSCTRKTVKWLLLLQYVVAVIWTIPFAMGEKVEYGICFIKWWFGYDYFAYFVLLRVYETLVPSAILIVLYTKICRQLISHQRNAKELFSTAEQPRNTAQRQTEPTAVNFQSSRQARNSRVVVTSIIITVLYAFGTVIIQIGGVLNEHVYKIDYEQFMWTAWVYYVCVASANPVIYGFRDKSLLLGYKRSLANIVSLFKPKKKRSVAVS